MKVFRNLVFFLIGTLLMSLAGCGGGGDDPQPTMAEQQFEKLSGVTWTVNQVTRDGNTVTDEFVNSDANPPTRFTITFFGDLNADKTNVIGSYTTNDLGGEVFPSGNWSFSENSINSLMIRIVNSTQYPTQYSVSDTNLQLSFTYSATGGRTQILDGDYTFSLNAPQ